MTERRDLDRSGRVERIVDDNRNWIAFAYDRLGRLKTAQDQVGNLTVYAYDCADNLILTLESEAAPGAGVSTYATRCFFDAADRCVASVDPSGNALRALYDGYGRIVYRSDARDGGFTTVPLATLDPYGEHGALSGTVNVDGNCLTWQYDDAGRAVATVRWYRNGGVGGGAHSARATSTVVYDADDRVVAATDAKGNVTSYLHDSLDRLLRVTHPDGRMHLFQTYDRNGNVLSWRDPNGTVVTQDFDDAGRLRSRTVARANGVLGATFESYDFDGVGRLIRAVNDHSAVVRTYDSLGGLIAESVNGRTVAMRRDGLGNLVECTYPSGRVIGRTFDARNRVVSVTEGTASIATAMWTGIDRVARVDLGNGMARIFEYDGQRRPRRVRHAIASTTVDDRIFEWNEESARTANLDQLNGHERRYEYDSTYRLKRSTLTTGAGSAVTDHVLDDVGNRVSVGGAGYAMSGQFSLRNQYSSSPLGNHTYDANGGLRTRGTQTFAYDYRDQLVSTTDSATGRVTEYAYDALGRRVLRVTDANGPQRSEGRFSFVRESEVEERDASNALVRSVVSLDEMSGLVALRSSGQDYWYAVDEFDTVYKLVNGAGQVVDAIEYGDFGQPLDSATLQPITQIGQSGNTLLFQGHAWDAENGLYDFRARSYDPVLGRFLTMDPLGAWGDPGSDGNPYSFVGNDPWSYCDPTGMKRCKTKKDETRKTAWQTSQDEREARRQARRSLMGDLSHRGSAPTPDSLYPSLSGHLSHHGSANFMAKSDALDLNDILFPDRDLYSESYVQDLKDCYLVLYRDDALPKGMTEAEYVDTARAQEKKAREDKRKREAKRSRGTSVSPAPSAPSAPIVTEQQMKELQDLFDMLTRDLERARREEIEARIAHLWPKSPANPGNWRNANPPPFQPGRVSGRSQVPPPRPMRR